MLWIFIGVWAIKRLDASNVQLAFGFLCGAISAAIGGYAGGHLSDRFGRRPLILVGWSIAPLVPLGALAAGTHLWWGTRRARAPRHRREHRPGREPGS